MFLCSKPFKIEHICGLYDNTLLNYDINKNRRAWDTTTVLLATSDYSHYVMVLLLLFELLV